VIAPETQLSASLSEGPLRRSNALDPPLAAILAADAIPAGHAPRPIARSILVQAPAPTRNPAWWSVDRAPLHRVGLHRVAYCVAIERSDVSSADMSPGSAVPDRGSGSAFVQVPARETPNSGLSSSMSQDTSGTPRDIEFRDRGHRWLELLVHHNHGCAPRGCLPHIGRQGLLGSPVAALSRGRWIRCRCFAIPSQVP
jgi:hypothetical protein